MRDDQFGILGATGQQGGAVVRALLRPGAPVRALVRAVVEPRSRALAAHGVTVVKADTDDPARLPEALAGLRGLFAMTVFAGHGAPGEVVQGRGGRRRGGGERPARGLQLGGRRRPTVRGAALREQVGDRGVPAPHRPADDGDPAGLIAAITAPDSREQQQKDADYSWNEIEHPVRMRGNELTRADRRVRRDEIASEGYDRCVLSRRRLHVYCGGP